MQGPLQPHVEARKVDKHDDIRVKRVDVRLRALQVGLDGGQVFHHFPKAHEPKGVAMGEQGHSLRGHGISTPTRYLPFCRPFAKRPKERSAILVP